jgi:serine/threonine protein kinase
MAILPGTRLGPYEILSAIGAGGMGEVYRARDTKLGRDVAIKALPEAFARDPERLSRFQREAKTLASLNHPNIAAIYGLEENAGSSYLVMELVPGDTLADRIKRDGAIPVVEAISIAKQMAEALEAAHEKGIVHRDLKPANVKVTPEGKVKVLDFGLAKAFADDGASQDISNSPTMSGAATMQGMILGTAAYMSPEQARGKQVDRRADIWAFGVVLYEMLTGEQLFAGETVTDTLAQVITKEPDWTRVPARMERFLHWCLEKDPKRRLRDISDGMTLMAEGPGQEAAKSSANSSSHWSWIVAGAACLVAAGLALVILRQKAPTPPDAYRLTVRLPDGVTFSPSAALEMSPDEHHVAFPAIDPNGRTSIWVQDMDGAEARSLSNTDPVNDTPPVFWSPDRHYVVFSSESKVREADISSGSVQDICDRPNLPVGGSWNRDGVIIFGSATTGLWRVPAEGGTPVLLTVPDTSRHEIEHELPSFLPDGRHFIYFINSSVPDDSGIYVGSLDDPPDRQSKKRLLASRFGASYVPSDSGPGHLLFLRDSALMAQSFDASKFELIGEPAPIAEQVGSAFETGHFAVGPDVLVYRGQTHSSGFQLTWYDAQGKAVGKAGDPGGVMNPHLSPDGNHVAYSRFTSNFFNTDVWLIDLKRDSSLRFTFGSASSGFPIWSPDGREIVFASKSTGNYDLYRKPVDGSKAEQLLLRTDKDVRPLSWSRDGRFLIYAASKNYRTEQMWILPMQGEQKPFPFSDIRFDESDGEFSPNGRYIAYSSNETGQYETYVREFTGSADAAATGGKWMVSKDGGFFPMWKADGKEIAYVGRNRVTIMALDVDSEHGFQPGPPRALLNIPADRGEYPGVVATADFKRFLMPVAVPVKVPQSFMVVFNWSAGLKK